MLTHPRLLKRHSSQAKQRRPCRTPEPVPPTIAPISGQQQHKRLLNPLPKRRRRRKQKPRSLPKLHLNSLCKPVSSARHTSRSACRTTGSGTSGSRHYTNRTVRKPAEPAPAENVIADTQNTPTAPQAAPGQADATTTDTDVNVGNDGLVTFTDTTAGDANGGMKLVDTRFNDGQLAIDIQDDLRQQVERYEVRMKDGSAAPEWVSVDTNGQLIVDAPDGVDS